MSKKTVRITIPRNADNLIALGEDILEKHNELGTDSPLQGLDITLFLTRVAEAKTKNAEQKQLRKDAETATEERDDLLGKKKDQSTSTPGTVLNFVIRSRDMLKGKYKGTEQRLGDFGFEVNQSTRSNSRGSAASDDAASTTDSATPTPS